MTEHQKIPPEIANDVIRQQTKMGWPDLRPAFAEMPNGCFKRFDDLNAGDCEQLVEHYSRKAHRAITKWMETRSPKWIAKAAHHILYARLYRCDYITIMGIEGTTEADMPFPCMTEDEIQQMEQGDAETKA